MSIRDVVVLKEATIDLENGFIFYKQKGHGVGSYFGDSLIADIESLSILLVFMPKHTGSTVCSQKDFPMLFIMKSRMTLLLSWQYYLSEEVQFG